MLVPPLQLVVFAALKFIRITFILLMLISSGNTHLLRVFCRLLLVVPQMDSLAMADRPLQLPLALTLEVLAFLQMEIFTFLIGITTELEWFHCQL